MDDGKELTDIIRAMDRSIVEHPITRLQVDGLIFHRSGITTTGSIDSPRIGPHLRR